MGEFLELPLQDDPEGDDGDPFNRDETEGLEVYPHHPMIGRQMVNTEGEVFNIVNIHLDDAFKPGLGPGRGTWEHAIVFTDHNGDRRWGPLRPYASPEEIIQELSEHGYSLLPPEEGSPLSLE